MARVVCFATVGRYAKLSKRLSKSLDVFEVTYDIDIIKNRTRTYSSLWASNTHYRSQYLLKKMRQYPGESILSLDADAIVKSNPIPFLESLECDIALHYFDKGRVRRKWKGRLEPLPGTLWLNPTGRTLELIVAWIQFAKNTKSCGDRFAFAKAIRKIVPKVYYLPPEYTFINGTMEAIYPKVKPIILHMQASRKIKRQERKYEIKARKHKGKSN